MKVVRTTAELRLVRNELAAQGRSVAFVPTMGALHDGHRSLMRIAADHADLVVVSIFVNPLQFGPEEDYARYPRPLGQDLEICQRTGVDVVFVPAVADLYPAGRQVSVHVDTLGRVFEGASRPGHFDGMLTVVLKLLNLVRPDVAVFGQKDAQQLACVRRMVIDLNLPVEIVAAPTVRESSGLALSSRNRYLSPPERRAALGISAALRAAAAERTAGEALAAARQVLSERSGLVVDYAALVAPGSFAEVPEDFVGAALLIVAAQIGQTRLIDNAELVFVPVPAEFATPA